MVGELNESMNLSALLAGGRTGQKAFCSQISEGLMRHIEDHLENCQKQLFPVTILEIILLILQIPREIRRGRLLVRLCKLEYIRMFFKELKRKLNLPSQTPSLFCIINIAWGHFEKPCYVKDRKS